MFNILIGVVRVKFVAVLLGTAGVGIIGLLNSPIQLIISITSLGIAYSAVRDISEAHGSGDQTRVSTTIQTLRRWSWFTGLLGTVVTAGLAPLLSQWTFGNDKYTWAFVWLSITLLLQAINKGQTTILQGTRRLKDMAKAGVIGSALGLCSSVPLYYFFKVRGIVPALIITAVIALLLSWYFSRRVVTKKINLTFKETYNTGIGMAKLGIYMTVAGFVSTLSSYILNAFISNRSGIENVGLYNAGWGVIGQYTSIIFTAMATDYFPRLSAINQDNEKVKELVRQQAEIALLIMTPLLILLLIAMPLFVRILYTPAFLPMVMFANLTLLGMQFKAISWAMGYVYLAKGKGQLFLTLEVISGVVILALNLIFYYFFELNGLGISFIFSYLFGMTLSYLVLRKKFGFELPAGFYRKSVINFGFMVLCFITVFIKSDILRYFLGGFILIIAASYSLFHLNEMMDLKSYIVERLKR